MRAMWLRVVSSVAPGGAKPVNAPPTTILPSDCTTMALTCALGFGENAVSRVPSLFTRARKPRVVVVAEVLAAKPGVNALNKPPTRIFPSDWTARAETEELGDGSNAVSSVPLALSRRRLERPVTPVAPIGVAEL